ncbi:MAG: beta-glucosidase [Solirubrobacteraceae bacterium]|nr:beta-glucosidase [Solirubrobacteraceae bacterium]
MSPRDLDALIARLTLDEKAALTAGRDNWSTTGVERAGIPPVRTTDGPNGARGSSVFGAGDATAVCVPCGSALGATWNPALIERVGAMLGEESRTKGARILLAPTLNLHRSPLSGRNFECLSEDPLLAGRLAAAYVRGVQSQGVATTPKHLAGNEAEFERYTISSVIGERALRELYLLPFELSITEGGALGLMTAYNRLNGGYCTENEALLAGIVRGEWGFDGFVVTDWYALGSTTGSARAGLDLEMPGPARIYGPALADAVRSGEVEEERLDAAVRRLLSVYDRIGALDDPPDEPERNDDRPEHRALAREAATEATVLLRNDGVLPLDAAALRRVAVIGPNAGRAQVMGGGSARLRAHYTVTPLEAIRAALGDAVAVVHERGCDTDRTVPPLRAPFTLELHRGTGLAGEPEATAERDDGLLVYPDGAPGGFEPDGFSFRARATFTPEETGAHTFTLAQAGPARLYVGGALVLDGAAAAPDRGELLIGQVSEEIAAEVELGAGAPTDVVLEYDGGSGFSVLRGAKVGHREPVPDDLLERAVDAARGADTAIVVVGTNDDWESEGIDRTTMDLPGLQDELVERVIAANPRTVVVVNAGAPVTMDWAIRAPALLLSWFGGQEMGGALADVLTGAAEPSGRLPTTQPERLEHNPSFGNFPGENGEVHYGEGVLIGYRWYEARRLPVRFPFGHGLSYTDFELSTPRVSAERFEPGGTLAVELDVVNAGTRRGAEVVQLYVAPLEPSLTRPPKELKAFEKVWLDPGERATVHFALGDRAFACWDPGDRDWPELARRAAASPLVRDDAERRTQPGWRVEPGRYELHIGRSSADVVHVATVDVA